jgi:hypothetical protein
MTFVTFCWALLGFLAITHTTNALVFQPQHGLTDRFDDLPAIVEVGK